ncbi:MAG: TraB/GumN family protein [Eubacteriales bacterium]|nr:TraB/GumN family protein [Eubacteriales bacterium]
MFDLKNPEIKFTRPIAIAGIAFIVLFNVAAYLIYAPVKTFNAGKKPASDQQLLFSVERDGRLLYLMGITHSGKLSDYPMRDSIENAFDSSDFLATERDLTTNLPSDFYGAPVSETVSSDVLARVQALADAYDLDPNVLNKYDALAISSIFENQISEKAGLQSRFGQDRYWTYRATKSKKPIVEAEGLAFEKIIANQINNEISEAVLNRIPFDSYQAIQDQITSYQAVKAGDIKMIGQYIDTLRAIDPIFTALFWDARNQQMLNNIEGWLTSDKQYFVAIGASHVVGQQGLVDLLEQAGYTVNLVQ